MHGQRLLFQEQRASGTANLWLHGDERLDAPIRRRGARRTWHSTSVATAGPLTGGPFSTTGTVACPTCTTNGLAATLNAIMLGSGLQGIAPLGSLGTAGTVLHGNVAGPPSWGQVSLVSEVFGSLPTANLPGSGIHTGDASGVFPTVTLATVNSTPGTCGDATHVCSLAVTGKGLVTASSSVLIAGGAGFSCPTCTTSAAPAAR